MNGTPVDALMPHARTAPAPHPIAAAGAGVALHDRAQREREREGGGGLRYRRVAPRSWAVAIFDWLLRTKE